MYIVMAAVDEFVALLDGKLHSGSPTPHCRPSPRRTIGEPAWCTSRRTVPNGRGSKTCSAWLKSMLRHHFYTKEHTAVPARSATNSRPL